MNGKYRIEVWLDNEWQDMFGFASLAEAEECIKSCEEDDRYLTRIFGYNHIREYRIREE